jgi:hypothetical protein
VYCATIQPYFDRGDKVWSTTNDANLQRLQRLQNRACRVICGVRLRDRKRSTDLRANLVLDDLDSRRQKRFLAFTKKTFKSGHKVVERFECKFTWQEHDHVLRSHDSSAAFVPDLRSKAGQKTIQWRATVAWNALLPAERRLALAEKF